MNKGFIIAIDGPAASGKGTITKMLTRKLDGLNLYSGGLYRALALKAIRTSTDMHSEKAVLHLIKETDISFGKPREEGKSAQLLLDGEDVSQLIKANDVAVGASLIGKMPTIRQEYFVNILRNSAHHALQNGQTIIADGQDMGTHVFPDAEMKIFLTATLETRTERRLEQYKSIGVKKNYDEIFNEIAQRDTNDFTRKIYPLSHNPTQNGYFLLDSTEMNADETYDKIITELRKRKLIHG